MHDHDSLGENSNGIYFLHVRLFDFQMIPDCKMSLLRICINKGIFVLGCIFFSILARDKYLRVLRVVSTMGIFRVEEGAPTVGFASSGFPIPDFSGPEEKIPGSGNF